MKAQRLQQHRQGGNDAPCWQPGQLHTRTRKHQARAHHTATQHDPTRLEPAYHTSTQPRVGGNVLSCVTEAHSSKRTTHRTRDIPADKAHTHTKTHAHMHTGAQHHLDVQDREHHTPTQSPTSCDCGNAHHTFASSSSGGWEWGTKHVWLVQFAVCDKTTNTQPCPHCVGTHTHIPDTLPQHTVEPQQRKHQLPGLLLHTHAPKQLGRRELCQTDRGNTQYTRMLVWTQCLRKGVLLGHQPALNHPAAVAAGTWGMQQKGCGGTHHTRHTNIMVYIHTSTTCCCSLKTHAVCGTTTYTHKSDTQARQCEEKAYRNPSDSPVNAHPNTSLRVSHPPPTLLIQNTHTIQHSLASDTTPATKRQAFSGLQKQGRLPRRLHTHIKRCQNKTALV